MPADVVKEIIEKIEPPNATAKDDVDATHRLTYDFVSDGKSHSLCLRIKDCKFEANPEPGELIEAVSFYKDNYKITLGCIASFGDSEDYNLDYDGSLCEDGLESIFLKQQNHRHLSWVYVG